VSDEKAGCETCKFLRRQDYGYSNWTVEGATLDCLKRLHPMEEIDDQFESRAFAEAMAFGATCAGRVGSGTSRFRSTSSRATSRCTEFGALPGTCGTGPRPRRSRGSSAA